MIRFSLLVGVLLFVTCCIENPHQTHETYSIVLQIKGEGTVTGFPLDSSAEEGDTLFLEAIPDDGSVFAGWEADGFTAENPVVIPVTGAFAIQAVFIEKPHDDMVFIPARDSQFLCGAASASAPELERPQHSVMLKHDFYISATEVTRGDYASVTGSGVPSDDDAELPVANITWYDAVRYCNRRSLNEGYDTVYSYTASCASNGGCGYVLENLTIHYNRGGYRLPTEAEWEYACRAGSTTRWFWGDESSQADGYAWYFDDAADIPHTVGGKKKNAFGLYDMLGNVAEWVNDWLDFYTDSALIDPVGPLHLTQEQFEENWERPIRGGSYHLSIGAVTSSTRKGEYPMPALGAQEDIGFRVVIGPFEAPLSAPSVTANDSITARVITNKSDIVNCIGTSRIKVAFVYRAGTLNKYCALADFSTSPVTIEKCGDDSTVNAPSISPDGTYLAYSSKGEGEYGTSSITIRSLTEEDFPVIARFDGFIPRWWVDPVSADTFIVYTTGASSNDRLYWFSEQTLRQKMTGGKPSGEADVLWKTGSYHGGLSSDGRYLGTAFTRAKLVDLQENDTQLYYFEPPWNGRNDTPQVCNLSMSPSKERPGNALFLDFGYSTSTLVGKPYRSHAIMFVGTTRLFSSEHIAGWYEVPAEYEQWNFPEYTNFPGAIISLAHNTGKADTAAIMLINGDDSLYCPLIKGMGLGEVAAWVDPAEVSEADDPYRCFGNYEDPTITQGQPVMAQKLRLFWHERERVSCVVMGNSPTMYGFDPHQITMYPTINVGWFQSSIGGSIYTAQHYVLPHASNLKALIIDLDASYFTVNIDEGYPRVTGLLHSNGWELDERNDFYRDGIPAGVSDKIAQWDQKKWMKFDTTGAFLDSIIGSGWGEPAVRKHDYSLDDPVVKQNLAMLEALIDSAAVRSVLVLAVNYPQNPGYKETDMVGRDGPSRETFLELVDYLHELEVRHDNFHFYDANNLGDHDYDDSMAFDTNHLNIRGGAQIASRIDSLLQILAE